MKKALPVVAVLMMLVGVGLIVRPDLATFSIGTPTQAVIVYESSAAKPFSPAMVEVLTKAPSIGVLVWDQNILGPGKKPSATAKPYLDVVSGKQLPQLALRWPSGSVTSQVCPGTFAELRKVVGK